MAIFSNIIVRWSAVAAAGVVGAVVLALGVVYVAADFAEAQAAPRSYPMTCRGGGQMRSRVIMHKNGRATLAIRFQKGTAGAGTRAPSAGQCTWIDRGMRPGEPRVLKLWISNVASIKFYCRQGRCRFAGSTNRNLNYLMKAVQNGSPFQVHAYNIDNMSNQGISRIIKRLLGKGFRVTRVGP